MGAYVLANSDLEGFLCVGAVVVGGCLGIIIYHIESRSWKNVARFCPSCQTVAPPTAKYQGSDWISFALIVAFFPGWIAYEVWRQSAAKFVCPVCRKAGMIPTTAPVAGIPVARLAFPVMQPSGPGRFRVSGVDRDSRMDCTQYYDADTEQNAKVKAELDGIVVTDVERVG